MKWFIDSTKIGQIFEIFQLQYLDILLSKQLEFSLNQEDKYNLFTLWKVILKSKQAAFTFSNPYFTKLKKWQLLTNKTHSNNLQPIK